MSLFSRLFGRGKDAAAKAAETVKPYASDAWDKIDLAKDNVVETVKSVSNSAAETVKEKVADAADAVSEKVRPVDPEPKPAPKKATPRRKKST